MKRQDLHSMDVVICSEEDLELQIGKEMPGVGVIVNGTTFRFDLGMRSRHSQHNRIVYQGQKIISRALKNGCYSIRCLYNPADDMLTFLKKAQEELDIAGRRIYSDMMERRRNHEV